MCMGPLVSYRAGTWLIDECQIVFFRSCLMLRKRIPPFVVISFVNCLTVNNLFGILDTEIPVSICLGLIFAALQSLKCPIFR